MNNDKRKQQQKSKILIGLIIVVVVQIIPVVLSMMDVSEGAAVFLAVLFLMAFVWLIFYVIFRNLRRSGKFPPSARGAKGSAGGTNVEFSDRFTGLIERMAKRDEEECTYGGENHRFSHDDEKRIAQLDSFLKNGIIDRAEYQVLKKRYSESGKQ